MTSLYNKLSVAPHVSAKQQKTSRFMSVLLLFSSTFTDKNSAHKKLLTETGHCLRRLLDETSKTEELYRIQQKLGVWKKHDS